MARPGWIAAIVGVALVAGAGAWMLGDRIERRDKLQERVVVMTGGDPDAGRAAIQRRPCGGCHTIPGIPGAKATVGPPLTKFAMRGYIAGRVVNTPDELVVWLKNPHAIDPQSAMPPMGIGEQEARDIAAYLYTLT
jgi:cytochrome c2